MPDDNIIEKPIARIARPPEGAVLILGVKMRDFQTICFNWQSPTGQLGVLDVAAYLLKGNFVPQLNTFAVIIIPDENDRDKMGTFLIGKDEGTEDDPWPAVFRPATPHEILEYRKATLDAQPWYKKLWDKLPKFLKPKPKPKPKLIKTDTPVETDLN